MDRPQPEQFGNEAYVSPEYAAAERERLWPKVWQHACRLEDIPEVGDYVTYDIADDTILVVRSDPETISAFYNVCVHRGKRLAQGCGRVQEFMCTYHAWKYNLKGECTRVLNPEDWGGRSRARTAEDPAGPGRYLGRLGVDQHGPRRRAVARIPRTRRLAARSLPARKDALPLAAVVPFRLQLESRPRGVHRGLPRRRAPIRN